MLLPNKIADLHAPLLAVVSVCFLLELFFILKLLSYKICTVTFLYAKLLDVWAQIADMLEYYLIHIILELIVSEILIIIIKTN
jgi:hypothetical protein